MSLTVWTGENVRSIIPSNRPPRSKANLEASRPLAIVDVETTGLSPTENRIAEIGVITVDGDRIDRWTTLVKTAFQREWESSIVSEPRDTSDAPSFTDIAAELARRLSGRLLIAHNARF